MKKIILFSWLLVLLVACAKNPQLGSAYRNTPKDFSENRLFYLKHKNPDGSYAVESDGRLAYYPLLSSHDLLMQGIDEKDRVLPNNPLAVILNGVFVPDVGQKNRDVAVVLTVQTSNDNTLKSLVVDYQTDVPPGQLLNMKDLLVFSDPLLDPTHPPYFKVQVIDITDQDNEMMGELLSASTDLVAQFADFIPYPDVVPALNVATKAADLLLDVVNPNNVLLEMEIMFYFKSQVEEAGGADLNQLKKGSWLVVGKPNKDEEGNPTDVTFWSRDFYIENARQKVLYVSDADSNSKELRTDIPYISLTMVTSDMRVPSLIVEKSATLTEMLISKRDQNDPTAIEQKMESLNQAVGTYIAHYKVIRYQNKKSLEDLIGFMTDNKDELTSRNEMVLTSLVNRITGENHSSVDSILDWWVDGGSDGCFDADSFEYKTGTDACN